MSDRPTFTEAVAEYFRARPNLWIDGQELARVGGVYAWRSRCSNCRTRLGMVIENRQRKEGRRIISEYRFVPQEDVSRSGGDVVRAAGGLF